jgi:hypothetical protein
MIRHKVDWELPLDLSSVQAVLLYRRIDDGTCTTEEECCEFTLGGDLILVDENPPFANQYLDLVEEIGEYRYSAFSRSFAGEIAPCATTTIIVSETVSLKILNYDERGEIIGGTSLGNTDTYKEYKTNYEFIYDIKSVVNLRELIKPKIGWVIQSVRYEDSDLTGSELSTFYIDKDAQLEVIYKQQTLKFKVEDDEESFLAYYPEEPMYAPAWTEQSIVAIPKDCYDFVRWEGGPEDQSIFDPTDSDTKFILDKSYTLKAIGEKTKYPVDVQVEPERGYVTESGEYTCDDLIYITADANEGYRFKRWSILKGSENIVRQYDEQGEEIPLVLENKTLEFYVTGPVVIKAIIEKIYILDLSWNNQWGITDPVEDQYLDAEDNSTKIAAVPREGGIFLRWKIMSGGENIISEFDLMDKNPQLIMISGDVALQAIFSEIYDLEVQLYLSRDYCKGTDCGKVLEHDRFAKVSGGGSGYHLENNIAEISISDVIEGYEFVGWQVVTGGENVSQLESMEEVQNVTLSGDATIRAVIQLVPHSIHVYPNFKILGSVIPRSKKNVTIRDVISVSASPRTSRVEFYKWNIIVGGDHIIPYQSDSFELNEGGIQKMRINGDVEIEAIFEKTYFLELTYKAYGFNGRDAGPNTVSNAYQNIELLEIRSPGRDTSFAGFFTKRDAIQIISNCKKQIPCVYEKDGKTSMFVFTEWKEIKNEDGIAPTTFSPNQEQQMLTLTSDLTLEAQLFQLYTLKIEYSTTDTSVGTFSGEGIYKCDTSGFASAPITAQGQISEIPVPSGEFDIPRPRLYEFDRWEIRMNPGQYRVSSFDKTVANQTIEMGSDLILRVYFLVPWELKLEPFVLGLTGMNESTQSEIIQTLGKANLRQSGDGTYRETEETEIYTESTNEEAFEFKEWRVGYHEGSVQWPVRADLSEQAQRIKIKKDTLLYADYELKYYNFSRGVNSHQPAGGHVDATTEDGSYHYFDDIELIAKANNGYAFEEWLIVDAPVLGVDGEGRDIYKKPQKWKSNLDYRKNRLIDIRLNGDLRMEAVFLLKYTFQTWNTREAWSDPNRKIDNTFVKIERKEPYRDNEYNKISFSYKPKNTDTTQYEFIRWIILGDHNFEGEIDLEQGLLPQTIHLTGDFTIVAEVLQISKLNIRLIPNQQLRAGTIKAVRQYGYEDDPENLQVFSRHDYSYIENFELFFLKASKIIEEANDVNGTPEITVTKNYYTGDDIWSNRIVGAEDPDTVSLGDDGSVAKLSVGIGNNLWEVNTTKMITGERLESGMPNMLAAAGKNYIPNVISGDLSEYHSPHTLQIRATYKEKIKLDIIDQNELIDFDKWEVHPDAQLTGFNTQTENQEGFNLLDNSTIYLHVKPKQYSLEVTQSKKDLCGDKVAQNAIAFGSNYKNVKLIGMRGKANMESSIKIYRRPYLYWGSRTAFNIYGNSDYGDGDQLFYKPINIYDDVFENLEEVNSFDRYTPYIDLSGYQCTGSCKKSITHSLYNGIDNNIYADASYFSSQVRIHDLNPGSILRVGGSSRTINGKQERLTGVRLYLDEDYTKKSDTKKYFQADEDILLKAWPDINEIKTSLTTEKNMGFHTTLERNTKFTHVFEKWIPVGIEPQDIKSFDANTNLSKSKFLINGLKENLKLSAKFEPIYYLCIRQKDSLPIMNYGFKIEDTFPVWQGLSTNYNYLYDLARRTINKRLTSSTDSVSNYEREPLHNLDRAHQFMGEMKIPYGWPAETMTDEQRNLFGYFEAEVVGISRNPSAYQTQEHKDLLQFFSRKTNPNKLEKELVKTKIDYLRDITTYSYYKYTQYDFSSMDTLDNKADTFLIVKASELNTGIMITALGYKTPANKTLTLTGSDPKNIFNYGVGDISDPHVKITLKDSVCRKLNPGDIIYVDVFAEEAEPFYIAWTLDYSTLQVYKASRSALAYPLAKLSHDPWISITSLNEPINYKPAKFNKMDDVYTFEANDNYEFDIRDVVTRYEASAFNFNPGQQFKINLNQDLLRNLGLEFQKMYYHTAQPTVYKNNVPFLINSESDVKYTNDKDLDAQKEAGTLSIANNNRIPLTILDEEDITSIKFTKQYFDLDRYRVRATVLLFYLTQRFFTIKIQYVDKYGSIIPILQSGSYDRSSAVRERQVKVPMNILLVNNSVQDIFIPFWWFGYKARKYSSETYNSVFYKQKEDGSSIDISTRSGESWRFNWRLFNSDSGNKISDFWSMCRYVVTPPTNSGGPVLIQKAIYDNNDNLKGQHIFKNASLKRTVSYNGVNVGKKHSTTGLDFELIDTDPIIFLEDDVPNLNGLRLRVDPRTIASDSITIKNIVDTKDFNLRISKDPSVNTNMTVNEQAVTTDPKDNIIYLDIDGDDKSFDIYID